MNLQTKIIEETVSELIQKFPELKNNIPILSVKATGNKLEVLNYTFPKSFNRSKIDEASMTIRKKANEYGIPNIEELE